MAIKFKYRPYTFRLLQSFYYKFTSFQDRAPLNKTFIFPNFFGFLFAGISFVLLLMAMGYANNLLYFFVFFLISMAITGMWLTNKNVESIQFEGFQSQSLFAKEKNKIQLLIKTINQKLASPHEIRFEWIKNNRTLQGGQSDFFFEHIGYPNQTNQTSQTLAIDWIPSKRGLYSFPRLEVSSHFPFSMLRAWKYFSAEEKVIVYPERKGNPQLPLLSEASEDEKIEIEKESARANDHGLFSHHREFQNRDSVHRIDWKRSAKFDRLFVKIFEDPKPPRQILTWGMTANLIDTEDRLSQLSYWIDICEKSRTEYKLILLDHCTEFAIGKAHYSKCMAALANFGTPDND